MLVYGRTETRQRIIVVAAEGAKTSRNIDGGCGGRSVLRRRSFNRPSCEVTMSDEEVTPKFRLAA